VPSPKNTIAPVNRRLDSQKNCGALGVPACTPGDATENNKEQPKMPGKGRPFQKGVSGNPGGRPKVLGDVQELARQKSPEAINTLVEIMNNDKHRRQLVWPLLTRYSIVDTENQHSQSRKRLRKSIRAR
jgi:Family of unknown function (DUF5681)